MLDHRLQRWPNIGPTLLLRCSAFMSNCVENYSHLLMRAVKTKKKSKSFNTGGKCIVNRNWPQVSHFSFEQVEICHGIALPEIAHFVL